MFIVFEGVDGSGKSSILEKIKFLFENKKIDYFLTKEPCGTNYGNFFKNIINENKFNNFSSLQFLLFQAERMIHLKEIIIPELKKNKIENFYFLDIGCGSGIHSVAANLIGADVFAFDIEMCVLE